MSILVTFCSNWADEFDCQQYHIYDTLEEDEEVIAYLIENGGYFGTNEGWEEGELSYRDFNVKHITADEANVLRSLLGEEFGTGLLCKKEYL